MGQPAPSQTLYIFFFISERFKISVSWLCIPWGTNCCCDEISINSAQFSIELTRQLISISVSLTSSALDLFSCDLARSQLGVMCVRVCAPAHACVILWELSTLSPTAVRDLSVRLWWGSVKLNSVSLYQLRCNSDTDTACSLQRQRLMTAQRLLCSSGHRVSRITFRQNTLTHRMTIFICFLILRNLLPFLELVNYTISNVWFIFQWCV